MRLRLSRGPRVVAGAGASRIPGWISTNRDVLDLTREADWARWFGRRPLRSLLAEHVWEHLTAQDAALAARLCLRYLEPGGRARIAVPDGLHPDPAYREQVRPGGTGPGADDHKVLYDYRSLPVLFREAGFEVRLLEWFDEQGAFHSQDWDPADGPVLRSARFDPRNAGGRLAYTSLILDALKPAGR
jgi:predicted SAM-dependent methyltransferase